MTDHVAGIGELCASNCQGDRLKTFALGSCVAVVIRDSRSNASGLVHIALPESKTNPDRAKALPGYFADTGIPLLLKELESWGMKKGTRGVSVKIIGGSNIQDRKNVFNIGKRNILAIKKILWQLGMGPVAEDVSGTISRTVSVAVSTGMIKVTSNKREEIEI